MLSVLPQPKRCRGTGGAFCFCREAVISSDDFSDTRVISFLKDELRRVLAVDVRISPFAEPHGITLRRRKADERDERYSLCIEKDGIALSAGSERGLFYAAVTLVNLAEAEGNTLPCGMIEDEPDIRYRGVWLDITRGRVPTVETVKDFIRRFAFYKINQVYFYMEHTFAYPHMTEGYRDASPMTVEDIIELREYAKKYFVELIPAIATLGHLYQILEAKSFRHLRAMETIPNDEYSWIDRQLHHTLDVSNPDALALSKHMIDTVCRVFGSEYVHIGCDETFDLGKGRSDAFAKGKTNAELYMGYVRQLCDFVIQNEKKPMIFDEMYEHPISGIDFEAQRKTHDGITSVSWDYDAEVHEYIFEAFQKAGTEHFACCGASCWSRFINDYYTAEENIVGTAKCAVKYGAAGVFNADWGDYGHVGSPESSVPLFALGAAFQWNSETALTKQEIASLVCRKEYGTDDLLPLLKLLHNAERFNWADINCWREKRIGHRVNEGDPIQYWTNETFFDARTSEMVKESYESACGIEQQLYDMTAKAPEGKKERLVPYLLAVRGVALADALLMIVKAHDYGCVCEPVMEPDALAVQFEVWLERYETVWRAHYRESELRRIAETVAYVCDYLRG